MTNRERENRTLGFEGTGGRGSVEETFYPWDETVKRLAAQGLPRASYEGLPYGYGNEEPEALSASKFFGAQWAESVMAFESFFGFDPLLRVGLTLPVRYGLGQAIGKEHVADQADWKEALAYAKRIERDYLTPERFQAQFGEFREGHQRGDFPVRVHTEGFFFAIRELLGIEEHLYAFYDQRSLLHDMSGYILEFYLKHLTAMLEILPADVLYLSEDLSGKNGSMISPALFEEFIGDYYRRLFPALRKAGAKTIFVDTDGEFSLLIPHFLDAGVDGFLPMDVNAGMDINEVRASYPKLLLIGGFNKLVIAKGKEEIDREFQRILPVIRQGGYLPGCDHQLPPDATLENYRYYVTRLKDCMRYAGANHRK